MAKGRDQLTFTERAKHSPSLLAQRLFALMTEKESNLCVALDESDPDRFLSLANEVGPHVAVLKTHIDTVEGFSGKLTVDLANLAREHQFLIFEDRKFADIGHTVKNQYTQGAFHVIEWAEIINAHALPGPGIVKGLREAAIAADLLDQRGLLLLAQMSSQGNFIDTAYTKKVIALAKTNEDFIIGFIGAGLEQLPELSKLIPPHFLIFSPGVKIGGGGDSLGQRYASPDQLVAAGADILVVGRDIIQSKDPGKRAKQYQKVCWEAYQQRIAESKVTEEKAARKTRRTKKQTTA